jgi:hypothetical protein
MFCVAGFRIVALSVFGIANPFLIVLGSIIAGVTGPIVLVVLTERFGLPNLFEMRRRRARDPALQPGRRAMGNDG